MSTLHLMRQGAGLASGDLPVPVYGVGVGHGQLGVRGLEPAAPVLVAHVRAQQALGTAESQPEAVQAVQAAWRAQLAHALQQRRLGGQLVDAGEAGRSLGAVAALRCACTDAEEAAGLCPRPLMAKALRAAGHRVVLDGVALPWMAIRAEVARPIGGGPLLETTACAHLHRSLGAAWECATKRLSPRPWTDPVGTAYRAREVEHGEVLEEEVKTERPDPTEERGQLPQGLAWTEWNHRSAQPHSAGLVWRTRAVFTRGAFELRIVYPYAPEHLDGSRLRRCPRTEGIAEGLALLLGLDRERLLQLYEDYHRPEVSDDGAEVVVLNPKAADRGPFAPAPEGALVLFPQRARPVQETDDDH